MKVKMCKFRKKVTRYPADTDAVQVIAQNNQMSFICSYYFKQNKTNELE